MFSQLGIGKLLGPILDRELDRKSVSFPNMQPRGDTLVMVSDFGGHHRGQQYHTYAFLTFDLEKNGVWLAGQRRFRESALNRRRISFKNMNDSVRRRSLIPFLNLANCIDGWLVLFAISKRGGSLFEQSKPKERALLDIWKPAVQEQLLRILHFSAFLLSGLTAPAQDVLWIIDEDDVAANSEQLARLTNLLGQISSHSLTHDMGHLRCGTTCLDDGTIALEDLAAIADLSAGAFCEIATGMVAQGRNSAKGIATPLPTNLSWKSRVLAAWLANDRQPLRRLAYIIQLDENSQRIGATALQWHAISGSLALPYRPLSARGCL